MHLPLSISLSSFFISFISLKMLFAYLLKFVNFISFFLHGISDCFLCWIFDILISSLVFLRSICAPIFTCHFSLCLVASFATTYFHDSFFFSSFHVLHRKAISPAPINSRLNVVERFPTPFRLDRNGYWPSRGSQLPWVLPTIFSPCCPLNDRRRAAHSFSKIGRFILSLALLPHLSPLLISTTVPLPGNRLRCSPLT